MFAMTRNIQRHVPKSVLRFTVWEKDTQVCQFATELPSGVQNIFTFKNQISQNNLYSFFLVFFLANAEINHV